MTCFHWTLAGVDSVVMETTWSTVYKSPYCLDKVVYTYSALVAYFVRFSNLIFALGQLLQFKKLRLVLH